MKQAAHIRSIRHITEKIDIYAHRPLQTCPLCGKPTATLALPHDAICKDCGYKDFFYS